MNDYSKHDLALRGTTPLSRHALTQRHFIFTILFKVDADSFFATTELLYEFISLRHGLLYTTSASPNAAKLYLMLVFPRFGPPLGFARRLFIFSKPAAGRARRRCAVDDSLRAYDGQTLPLIRPRAEKCTPAHRNYYESALHKHHSRASRYFR